MKVIIRTTTHVHEGELVPTGTVLEVDEATAQHLVSIEAADIYNGKEE